MGRRDSFDWKEVVPTWPTINKETERERLWLLPTLIRTTNTLIAAWDTLGITPDQRLAKHGLPSASLHFPAVGRRRSCTPKPDHTRGQSNQSK